jgi:hypothetical protein
MHAPAHLCWKVGLCCFPDFARAFVACSGGEIPHQNEYESFTLLGRLLCATVKEFYNTHTKASALQTTWRGVWFHCLYIFLAFSSSVFVCVSSTECFNGGSATLTSGHASQVAMHCKWLEILVSYIGNPNALIGQSCCTRNNVLRLVSPRSPLQVLLHTLCNPSTCLSSVCTCLSSVCTCLSSV